MLLWARRESCKTEQSLPHFQSLACGVLMGLCVSKMRYTMACFYLSACLLACF